MSCCENQQVINFDQIDESLPILIHSRDVVILPSSRTLDNDSIASNKITTQNVVDYSWEDRYTLGHLISYHSHTSLIAYVLSISNNYMIRILMEEHTSRCLIKDFTGEITDIAFSKSHTPYIASIDINGSVKVNKVNISQDLIECQLILLIKANPSIESVKAMKVSYSRVMWCWHNDTQNSNLEESDSAGTNISLLLGVVHASTFEVMQIDTIESELLSQSEGTHYEARIDRSGLRSISNSFREQYYENENLSDLFLPYLVYTAPGEDSKITSLAISSDAAAFAVAMRDGTVRFFTLDGSDSSGLKEAYSWRPFNGEAVWSLLFLDDCHPGSNIDSFWCHVVVGGAFNRELKLFRCDKWDCIQTVSFQSSITPCLLSAHIDESARYLIMSDIRRKALYVLELDSIDNDKTKLFKNVQEFVLNQSLLSFDINTITSSTTAEGGNQITIKLFTITKGAFQKMRIAYISRGHRLNEIKVDVNNDVTVINHESINVVPDHLPVSTSLLTQVSSLPSTNSSFQDPAIISTQMHSNTKALKSLPVDIPPSLQHLFTGSMDDRKRCVNDSGEESGDEASLIDLVLPNEQHKITESKKFTTDEDEECGFPLPPYGTNGAWNSGPSVVSVNAKKSEDSDENINLNRLEILLQSQQKQIEALTNAIQELQLVTASKENTPRCLCSENRQNWTDLAIREINGACQKAVGDQLDRRLREIIDGVVPRVSTDVIARLDETIRNKLQALEPVTREYLNGMFHDKKFIGFMANNIADTMDKPLRAAYTDMVRKEFVPALGKSLEKLFSDTHDVMCDGIKDVLGSVNESNRISFRALEDKLVSCIISCQKNASGDWDNNFKLVMNELGTSRICVVDGFNKQRDQINKLNEALKAMKESVSDYESANNHITKSNSMANIPAFEQPVMREQLINKMINSGDFSGALNEALGMTDMRVLLSTCTRIQTKRVLSGNAQKQSPLQSSSILALIQQLSRDFQYQFDIKFEYLFDALLSMDTNEPGIKNHVTKILKGVLRRLQSHYDQEANPVFKDKITVLVRLVSSRLDS